MATKTPREEILEAVQGNFHTYLGKGVRVDQIIGDAHPELGIDDIETLLRIHFVLTKYDDSSRTGVINFMEDLEDQIRRLKTTTTRAASTVRGEVRGHVDWQQTVKERSRTGDPNLPVFVCRQPEKHYSIEENLVLKRLLAVIRDILFEDLDPLFSDPHEYGWLGYWISEVESDIDTDNPRDLLNRLYSENVYLNRISLEENRVTDRMIESVKRSRNEFYREAAELLDRYRRLLDHEVEPEEVSEVLTNTVIAPDKPSVLFELYWIFRILDSFEDIRYQLITESSPSVIARWTTDTDRYVLYHNATGEGVNFAEKIDPDTIPKEGYLFRLHKVIEQWQELSRNLLDRSTEESLWGGRPDILIEKYSRSSKTSSEELDQVFVGEVKYTRDSDYAASGLRELLEYMAFVTHHSTDDYVESEKPLSSNRVTGLLFVDRIEGLSDSNEDIRILEYGDDIPDIFD